MMLRAHSSTFGRPSHGEVRRSRRAIPFTTGLPPGFRLDPVGQSVCPGFEGSSTDKAAQAVGPVRVGNERAQCRAAEELLSRLDLWCDCEFPQPAVKLAGVAARVVGTTFHRDREVLR